MNNTNVLRAYVGTLKNNLANINTLIERIEYNIAHLTLLDCEDTTPCELEETLQWAQAHRDNLLDEISTLSE